VGNWPEGELLTGTLGKQLVVLAVAV